MLLCLLVAAVIALMILQFRKINAESGKTPDGRQIYKIYLNSWWSIITLGNLQNLLKLLRSTITSGVLQNLLKLLLVVDNYFGRSTFCCLRCLMGVFGCLDNCELRGDTTAIFLKYFCNISILYPLNVLEGEDGDSMFFPWQWQQIMIRLPQPITMVLVTTYGCLWGLCYPWR